jgi:uncharacterized protein
MFSGGVPLAGRVHGSGDRVAVVTGSWLTVKEQMPDRYAAELARRGWTAFTFDFAGFGGSGGAPRQFESPARKIADLTAAVAYARTLGRPVHLLSVCASAQYAFAAVAAGLPVAGVASVAGWFHDAASVEALYGGAAGVSARLARADAALDRWLSSGSLVTVPAYDPADERAGMSMPLDYYGDPARGAIPSWTNAMAEMSWRPWLTFDGVAPALTVRTPALFVHSDAAVLPDNVRRIAAATGAATRWLDGEQIDFYDRPTQVTAAVDAFTEEFG